MVKASRDQFGENILAVRILAKSVNFTFISLSLNLPWWKLVEAFGENILAREFSHLRSNLPKSEVTMVKASEHSVRTFSRWEFSPKASVKRVPRGSQFCLSLGSSVKFSLGKAVRIFTRWEFSPKVSEKCENILAVRIFSPKVRAKKAKEQHQGFQRGPPP